MFQPATTVGIAAMLSLMVMGALFMKIGAMADPSQRWLFSLVGTQSLFGISCYGVALILYAWLLKTVPLNVMQSLTAAQFVAIIIASAFILAEPIPPMRWIGIALILAGLWFVAISVNRGAA